MGSLAGPRGGSLSMIPPSCVRLKPLDATEGRGQRPRGRAGARRFGKVGHSPASEEGRMTQVNPRFVLLLLALAGLALNGCEPGTQPGPGDTGTDGGDHGGDGGDTEPELTEPRGAEASLQIQVVRD